MGDGDIDGLAIEPLGRLGAGGRDQPQGRFRRGSAKGLGEMLDQRDLGIFGHAGGKDALAQRRFETRAGVQRRVDLIDRGRHQGRDLACPGSRLHPAWTADKQIVGEEIAQTRQRMAHRRLRQTDAPGGAGDRALGHQGVERFQEVQVDGADIHDAHDRHMINRLDK